MSFAIPFSHPKKHEYWNHFINRCFVEGNKPNGVTGPRLKKIKMTIWCNDVFWNDILHRHACWDITPEAMKLSDRANYDHMIGNFSSMVVQTLVEQGLIK